MLLPGLRRSHLLGVTGLPTASVQLHHLFIPVRAAGCESAPTNTVTCSLKRSLVTRRGFESVPVYSWNTRAEGDVAQSRRAITRRERLAGCRVPFVPGYSELVHNRNLHKTADLPESPASSATRVRLCGHTGSAAV